MLRRNVNHPGGSNSFGDDPLSVLPGGPSFRSSGTPPKSHRSTSPAGRADPGESNTLLAILCSPRILCLVAVVVTILTYVPYPPKSAKETFSSIEHQVEQQAGQMAQQAYHAEQKMMDWWKSEGRQKPPIHEDNHPGAHQHEATARMLQHESKWVDGEKKLKQRLKLLAERQAQGKDIGVPVLTRWLGDDFPAWVGEKPGMDETVWKKNVQEKYAQMRKEEEEWQKMVLAKLEEEKDRG